MRKFIDSQVKSKDERQAEKEVARAEREQQRASRQADKDEKLRHESTRWSAPGHGIYGSYGQYGSGDSMVGASGAEFEPGPHYKHFTGRRLANPAPLGLFAFAFSTFLLGLINLSTQGVTQIAAVVAPFLMYSAVMMSITAIFELIAGNTFGATAFGTFAGFFLSTGAIILPSFGTFTAFEAAPLKVYSFLGLFFATWCIPFGIFCFLTIRSTWTLWLQFIAIFAALALSCAQYLRNNDPNLRKAAGALLILVSFFGYLNGSAGLMAKETVFFQPPILPMPWSSEPVVAGLKGPDHPHNNPHSHVHNTSHSNARTTDHNTTTVHSNDYTNSNSHAYTTTHSDAPRTGNNNVQPPIVGEVFNTGTTNNNNNNNIYNNGHNGLHSHATGATYSAI